MPGLDLVIPLHGIIKIRLVKHSACVTAGCGQGLSGMDLYFAMARGTVGIAALDMTKFFDTNYHYIVPELGIDFTPQPSLDLFLDKVARGQQAVGIAAAVPIVIGGWLSEVLKCMSV